MSCNINFVRVNRRLFIYPTRSKFSATASLGVIHRGQVKDSLALMQNYLPKDTANSSGYAEGGCLYALGLIHANHGGEITDYLLGQVNQLSGIENVKNCFQLNDIKYVPNYLFCFRYSLYHCKLGLKQQHCNVLKT
jgi:hypothetical protein